MADRETSSKKPWEIRREDTRRQLDELDRRHVAPGGEPFPDNGAIIERHERKVRERRREGGQAQ